MTDEDSGSFEVCSGVRGGRRDHGDLDGHRTYLALLTGTLFVWTWSSGSFGDNETDCVCPSLLEEQAQRNPF